MQAVCWWLSWSEFQHNEKKEVLGGLKYLQSFDTWSSELPRSSAAPARLRLTHFISSLLEFTGGSLNSCV